MNEINEVTELLEKETKKLNFNNYNEAKEILRRFIDIYLHGNIDELKTFSFWNILNDDDFNGVSKDKGRFDGDRTRIVYAIDYLLYHQKIPNLSLGYNGFYNGDTINSFRTLFGNRFTENNTEEEVSTNLDFNESEISIKEDFFRTYQKIGNFYILPTGKTADPKTTINQYRGTDKEYRDYFDIFLTNLNLCLLGRSNDKILESLINEEKNNEFFSLFSSIQKFCEVFYLSDYLQIDYNHPKTIDNSKTYYRTANVGDENYKKLYKKFAFGYISKATELINNRSNTIVEILKEKYPELK